MKVAKELLTPFSSILHPRNADARCPGHPPPETLNTPSRIISPVRTALVAIVLIALVPLAGCLGSGGPSEDAGQPAADGGNATDGSGSGDDGVEAEGNETGNETYNVDEIDWSGSTGPSVCVGPSSGCFGLHGDARRDVDLGSAPEEGNVSLTGTVNLTWEADTPLTQGLRFQLFVIGPEGEEHSPRGTIGGSPLTLRLDRQVPADHTVQLGVDPPNSGSGPTTTRFSTDQSFTATGQIVVAAG